MAGYVVADASVFILGKKLDGELITVPSVERELKDLRSKSLLDIYRARVESPSMEFLKKVRIAAKETGDLSFLSDADQEVLAKALEYDAVLATDDYALQNVALHIGLRIEPLGQPAIKRQRRRIQRCSACGVPLEGESCPDCGTLNRKKNKRCFR
jgi:endoribonuclease Nob1